MKYLMLAVSLLATGCSVHYTKDGSSTRDFKRDITNCQVKAGQAGFQPVYKWGKNAFLDQCMEAEGWTRDK